MPYRLDIPFVNLATMFEPWLLGNPALPSVVPFNMYRGRSSHMSFWERLDNTYRQLEWMLYPQVGILSSDWPLLPFCDWLSPAENWIGRLNLVQGRFFSFIGQMGMISFDLVRTSRFAADIKKAWQWTLHPQERFLSCQQGSHHALVKPCVGVKRDTVCIPWFSRQQRTIDEKCNHLW